MIKEYIRKWLDIDKNDTPTNDIERVNPVSSIMTQAYAQGAPITDVSTKFDTPKAGGQNTQALVPVIGPDPVNNQTPEAVPFGPLQPIGPFYQAQMKDRIRDYRQGFNLEYTPGYTKSNTFATLRNFADNYDLLRLCIETRKDQMCGLNWDIRYKDKSKDADKDCEAVIDFFKFPDGEHNFYSWMRMLLEDMLVIDGVAIYPRVTKGGELLSLDPIDGSLISLKIDALGRRPKPPSTAYQQILVGLPAVNYCAIDMSPKPIAVPGSELIYNIRNPRTHALYGFSYCEQILMIINIALRREVNQLQYFTEGSLPDLLIGLSDDLTADQINDMQELFDTLLSGNTAERRKTRFIPGKDVKFFDTKERTLKDDFDEWLARIVCYCFSLPATPFVKGNNRATADTAKESAEEEGLEPIKRWFKELIDMILARYFSRDLEFIWDENNSIDPLTQATIFKTYLQEYVMSPEEVREALGMKGDAPVKPLLPLLGQPTTNPDGTPATPEETPSTEPEPSPKGVTKSTTPRKKRSEATEKK